MLHMLPNMIAVRVKYIDNDLKYWLGEERHTIVVVSKCRRKHFSTPEEAEQAIQIYQATVGKGRVEYYEVIYIEVIEKELVCKRIKNN